MMQDHTLDGAQPAAQNRRMATLNLEWLREALALNRGMRKHLAAALGVHPSQVTRIAQGSRRLYADEQAMIEQFCAEARRGAFHEPAVAPYAAEPMQPSQKQPAAGAPPDTVADITVSLHGATVHVDATLPVSDLSDLIRRLRILQQMAE